MTLSRTTIALATALMLGLAACGGGGDDSPAPSLPDTGSGGGNQTPPPDTAAKFTLALATDKAVVLQGASVSVKATLTRASGFTDAVQVVLSGLPAGVTAPAVTIPAGATEATLVLQAQASAPHSLPTGATAQGSAGTATASKPLTVTVRGLPGDMDTSFAGGQVITPVDVAEDYANALAVQADGKVLQAGSSMTTTGTVISLVRHLRDGGLDTTFGTGGKVLTAVGTVGNATATAIAVQPDGRILVAGYADLGATGLDMVVLRYLPTGSPDTTFGTNGRVTLDFAGSGDRAFALLVQADGKIVIGGDANLGSTASGLDFALARLNANGTLDAGFGTGGKVTTAIKSNAGGETIRALAVQTVAGVDRLLAVGGDGDFIAARYTTAGALDAGFGTAGKINGLFNATIGHAAAVTLLPDGRAVLAGQINHQFAAVRLTTSGALDTTFGVFNDGRWQLNVVNNWNEATAVVRQADGQLVFGGWAYSGAGSSGDFAAVRISADGVIDTGFANAGVLIRPMAAGTKNDIARALVLQNDDRVPTVRALLGGEANGSNHDFALLRLWL